MSAENKLKQLEIELPQPAKPVGAYVPFVKTGSLLYVSGQLPMVDGELKYRGTLGQDITVEEAQEAARACALNALAQAKAAAGSLDNIVRVVRLNGFVAAEADFTDHAMVMNGASELVAEVMGDAGKHTRIAVGCPSLPLGAPVEIDAIFEIKS